MLIRIITAALFLAALTALIAYICFRMAFYNHNDGKKRGEDILSGKAYESYLPLLHSWTDSVRAMPCEEFFITSFDGLKLRARYYECIPGAPVELLFHGYRGSAERDMAGGVHRCFLLGRNALLVDQRASGGSEGHVISFGVNEHRDCLSWVDFMCEHFGKDVKLILTGISMGASTVLMCADKPLPENVVGVLADCGYTSAREIIRKVIAEMKLPVGIGYFFVKLGARLYGRFDLEACPAVDCVKRSRLPIIFFHGEEDDFVPCDMSRENFAACTSRKKLVTVPGAAHGISFPVAPEAYISALRDFYPEYTLR